MKRILLAIETLIAAGMVPPLGGQTITPELRPFVGAYMPTGAMRDVMKSSALFGLQGALEVKPNEPAPDRHVRVVANAQQVRGL